MAFGDQAIKSGVGAASRAVASSCFVYLGCHVCQVGVLLLVASRPTSDHCHIHTLLSGDG